MIIDVKIAQIYFFLYNYNMPEGNSGQSPDNPIQRGVQEVRRLVKTLRYAKFNPLRRPMVRILPTDQPTIAPIEPDRRPTSTIEETRSPLTNAESNLKACEQFLKSLRDPSRYQQDPHNSSRLKNDLGFSLVKPLETGFFEARDLLNVAEERYKLPLALYVSGSHARLVVKGPYQEANGQHKIFVYDPMTIGFKEISVTLDRSGIPIGIYANQLARSNGKYKDLYSNLNNPRLVNQSEILQNAKAFNFQRDLYNCVPISFFVGAMLAALDPSDTPFKRGGIEQFEQDFGVRILTREQLLPKPRVRVIGES